MNIRVLAWRKRKAQLISPNVVNTRIEPTAHFASIYRKEAEVCLWPLRQNHEDAEAQRMLAKVPFCVSINIYQSF